jgi:hypothetical protein
MRAIKRNLKDQITDKSDHRIMLCPLCGEESSANKGDYFMLPEDHKFQCCGQTMELVTKVTSYRK